MDVLGTGLKHLFPAAQFGRRFLLSMTGSMYAAISGLKAHMNKLNVIGNNVANVNTYGFKPGRVVFSESLYTSMKTGTSGNALSGSTNPSQIGYGSQIGTIDLDMSTKSFVPTNGALDCMIKGDGFFLVGDKLGNITSANTSSLSLTRVGDFEFDEDGWLVDGYGNVVYGFVTAANADSNGTVNDYTNADNPNATVGVSTELVPIRLPLAAKAPDANAPTDPDAEGYYREGSAVYHWVDENGYTHEASDRTGATGDSIANDEGKCIQLDSISIDNNGMISGINKATKEVVVVGYVALASVDNPGGVTHVEGPYYRALGGAGDVRIASVGNTISGYLNNKSEDDDPTALDLIMGTGDTEIQPNGLESSGTDIATEFSEMITTQRGYQANTRIVTVTDTMLEELVNMKR